MRALNNLFVEKAPIPVDIFAGIFRMRFSLSDLAIIFSLVGILNNVVTSVCMRHFWSFSSAPVILTFNILFVLHEDARHLGFIIKA